MIAENPQSQWPSAAKGSIAQINVSTLASQMGGLDAMAEALRETLFRNLTATPLEFYRILGVRVGFLRPGGQPKYFTLESALSEMPAWAVTAWWVLDPAKR